MQVLVATDGTLDPSQVVAYVAPLAHDGAATVMTVTEIPRTLLRDLRTDYGEQPTRTVATAAE